MPMKDDDALQQYQDSCERVTRLAADLVGTLEKARSLGASLCLNIDGSLVPDVDPIMTDMGHALVKARQLRIRIARTRAAERLTSVPRELRVPVTVTYDTQENGDVDEG